MEKLSVLIVFLIFEMLSFKYLDTLLFPPASNFNPAVFSPTESGKIWMDFQAPTSSWEKQPSRFWSSDLVIKKNYYVSMSSKMLTMVLTVIQPCWIFSQTSANNPLWTKLIFGVQKVVVVLRFDSASIILLFFRFVYQNNGTQVTLFKLCIWLRI